MVDTCRPCDRRHIVAQMAGDEMSLTRAAYIPILLSEVELRPKQLDQRRTLLMDLRHQSSAMCGYQSLGLIPFALILDTGQFAERQFAEN